MDRKYKKGGDAGSKGVRFQVSLLTLFLLKAIGKLKDWRLSTENKEAGKFDDVVLESPEGAVLLQAKHRENKKTITLEELLSANTKKDDFSLPKYFLSYQEIKCRFKVKYVIVCTNANYDKNTFPFLNSKKPSSEDMLYYEADDCAFYSFDASILPDLKNNTKNYLQQCRSKIIDESDISDENLKDFLEHLQFYFNYPSEKDIENIIERQLCVMRDTSNFYKEISLSDIHSKVMDWFQQKDGEYLTEIAAKAMLFEIKKEKYWLKLERYDVFFQYNNLKFNSAIKIFHIVDDEGSLLREIQIYRTLKDIKTVLCVCPGSDVEELKEILEAFELPKYTFLAIIWSKAMEESLIHEVTSKLEQILTHKNYKQVILVTGNNNELTTQFQLRNLIHETINHSVIFDDLSGETKQNLLKKRIINCQGNTFNLEELLALETTEDCGAAMNTEISEKLIRSEEITVGSRVQPLDPRIECLYINRTFIRDDEEIEEGNIFEVKEKVILIADGPGMGKSTILTHLANAMKIKHPNLWVIKIILNNYSSIFNTFLSENIRTLNIFELLDSQIETRLTHQLEKHLFSTNNRIVLMLDGVDEISPNYTELVESLIVHCQQAPNFLKVLVTSRPHVIEQLEKKLKVKSFKLQPFTEQNQVDFLTNYWALNLELDDKNKEKCELYAKALLREMWFTKNRYYMDENDFTSIPLQVRMLAEIFQERNQPEDSVNWQGCKEYLEAKVSVPNLLKQIDFAKLFKMFVDKKRSAYLKKSNPSGNAIADISINRQFDECLEYHRAQALEVILDKQKCELFRAYKKNDKSMENEVLHIGIIQRTDNEIYFIHRTFVEYFVAECLIRELQCQNRNVKFQEFLIDQVLRTRYYPVVSVFFDSFLQEVLDSLPSDIFKEYYITYKTSKYPLYLMHDLAGNGHVAILQLILKSIDFETIKPPHIAESTRVHERGIYDTFSKIKNIYKSYRYRNALSVLRFCVRQDGVNITDSDNETPLDHAIDGGHLDMVKFLVEQGANINYNRPPSEALGVPLCRAVSKGHLDIVRYLVEQGANIKPNHEWGYRILFEAVSRDFVVIGDYLLERILQTDYSAAKYPIIPYTAAYLGQFETLKALLKGAPVNSRIHNGETVLFGAARGGYIVIVLHLLDDGADINCKDDKGNTALHIISKNPSLNPIANILIMFEIDVNVVNFHEGTALHIAASEGNLEAAQLLIQHGANVNAEDIRGKSVLYNAVDRAHLNIVKLLIENGANIHKKSRSVYRALREAIETHKPHIVDFLLDFGVDMNTKNSERYPLLHSAVRSDQMDTIKYLVECGIDLNVTDEDGDTALHVAVDGHHLFTYLKRGIIRYLVDSGVDVNVRNKDSRTALHVVLKANESRCLRLVRELDVDTYGKGLEAMSEAVMVERWTANCYRFDDKDQWHLPVFARHLSTIIFLIKRGTDVNIKDSRGNTILYLIKRKGGQGGQLLLNYLGLELPAEKK